MTEFTNSIPQKPARSRRRYVRTIILAFCATLALTVLVTWCAVAVVVAAVFNGFDAVFGLGAIFDGIGEALAVAALSVLAVFPWLMEMASLLSTGQLIPFVMRLIHLLVK
jgi:predicted exporter